MHKNTTKCNKTQSKWCINKHEAQKIIDTFETYQSALGLQPILDQAAPPPFYPLARAIALLTWGPRSSAADGALAGSTTTF
jgi:hypothetical protein